ncbi:MAG TPA: efflux RND transporter periplasmic adaptor subunit [Polyangiaceae bacterium]|nr:efflux RND transporter periplasmic adaptor subunit [Polyangiaceae bacterium]
MKRRWLVSLTATLAVLVAGAAVSFRSSKEAAAESRPGAGPKPVSVQVARVESGRVRVVLSGLGTVTPRRSVAVRSRVSGQISRIAFSEGQQVEPGQLLAELDPRTFQAEEAKAKGQLAQERALLENARLELERSESLSADSLISAQQVAAQQSLHAQRQGAEQLAVGNLTAASLQLGFTRITAPIRGRVGFRLVDAGNNVTPLDNIVQIHELAPITVVFTLTEDQLPEVLARVRAAERAGHPLDVEAWDKGNRSLLEHGQLLTVDNQIDPATGTVRLKAEFSNAEGQLFPSQFVNVRLAIDELRDALTVPRAAVQRGRQGSFVYLLGAGEVVEVRPVKLGVVDGAAIVIEDGLAAGDRVVVSGADQVREGSQVKIAAGGKGERAEPPRPRP